MKKEYEDYFKGKKITVMGLGLLGRGIGVVSFLAECGAELTVTDLKSKEDLAPALKTLKKFPQISYVLGEHRLQDFRTCDMVIKAAGVPLDSPFIAEAKKNGIPIEMDASLFCRLWGGTTVGVTGTRGKSTTTHALHHILTSAGVSARLGGNVRGLATLPLLKKIKKDAVVVLELDSWQLQGFGDAGISPHIAIFTNFMPDHLNYYKGSMDAYFRDKAHIFLHQKKEDALIVGTSAWKEFRTRGARSLAAITVVRKVDPLVSHSPLIGAHTHLNLSYAVAAARALGLNDAHIKRGLKTFRGVSGRLEPVAESRGVEYWNDTTATTPEALRAALDALSPKRRHIVLIAGGTNKALEYRGLAPILGRSLKTLVLLPGTATDALVPLLNKKIRERTFFAPTMKEAFRLAILHAHSGDVVLLSPGAASFGVFKNEYDRGDQFVALVKKYVSSHA